MAGYFGQGSGRERLFLWRLSVKSACKTPGDMPGNIAFGLFFADSQLEDIRDRPH